MLRCDRRADTTGTMKPMTSTTGYGHDLLRALLLMLSLTVTASAQQSIVFGTGYEFGVPLTIDRTRGALNTRPDIDGSGSSRNHTAWFAGGVTFPQMFGERLGLASRFGLAISSGLFRSNGYRLDAEVDQHDSIISRPAYFQVDALAALLQFELRASMRLGEWTTEAGVWGSGRIFSSFIQKEYAWASDPANAPASETVIATGDRLGSNQLRFGAVLSQSLDIPIAPSLALRPELYTRLDIGALSGGEGLRAFSIGGGLSFVFGVMGSEQAAQPQTPRLAPSDPAALNRSRQLRLDASIDLYSGDPSGDSSRAFVHAEDIVHRLRMPLLPVIFFERDSSSIPSRYALLRQGESHGFTNALLAGLEPAAIYHHVLNLIGLRMRSEPSASILLFGSAASDEPVAVAEGRSRAVARYLEEVWGIDPSRVMIRSGRSPAGSDPSSRSVRILNAPPSIGAPVMTQWVARSFLAPPIGLKPEIDAEAGVREWRITLMHGRREVGRYSSAEKREFPGVNLSFLEQEAGKALPPLVAILTVEDSAGQRLTVRDTLGLAWDSTTLLSKRNVQRETLRFLLIDHNRDSSSLYAGSESLFQKIPASIRQGARLTISSDSSREERSSSDGRWRAERVAEDLLDRLRARGVHIAEVRLTPLDPDDALGAQELPEARMLASGAEVVVEQEMGEEPERQ
jgi:hypothetical protein